MKKILMILALLSIMVLSGCYKSEWSKSQKVCDGCNGECVLVDISDGTFYKCEPQEEINTSNCARKTFEEFNLTNESPEAKTLSFIMGNIASGSDKVELLEKLSQKELEIFLYNMECLKWHNFIVRRNGGKNGWKQTFNNQRIKRIIWLFL